MELKPFIIACLPTILAELFKLTKKQEVSKPASNVDHPYINVVGNYNTVILKNNDDLIRGLEDRIRDLEKNRPIHKTIIDPDICRE